jgi:hypothetical protein
MMLAFAVTSLREDVDRQILNWMKNAIEGHEDLLTEQTAKMLGQEDPFSRAMIQNQLKQIDQQFEQLLNTGIPEEGRAYMGMMGFQSGRLICMAR